MIVRLCLMAIGVILTSFYLFPVELGPVNTKLLMAIFGIPAFLINAAQKGISRLNSNLLMMVVFAILVSFTSWLAVIINNTNDNTYVTYVMSMFVWLAGAYTLTVYLKAVHKNLHIKIVCMYLVSVGAMQCILAILIDNYPSVEDFFLRLNLLKQGEIAFARNANRLFGVGCAYDPAGIRLASILVISCFMFRTVMDTSKPIVNILYICGIYVITVIGSMISRTTTVGFILGLLYILYDSGVFKMYIGSNYYKSIKWLLGSLAVACVVVAVYYSESPSFRENFRFGFEGFVSLIEKGEWEVSSNEQLLTMYRFPESLHTWLIGDGYIDTTDKNPYYTGPRYKGYYMATDVGYLRFIYYAGIPMLLSFIIFFVYVANTCSGYFPKYKKMFWMLLLLQLAVWLKVATDLFCTFAVFVALGLYLSMGKDEIEENNSVTDAYLAGS